ncbi:hypothetical protein SanaruYs_04760 [Chryseotalea sanaruensis]|uniref:OmpA-like domain-containing protein n=1 Tax=Chryseotalea sanaruensis TaxID=2482724 RepID=A0A401U5R6_9BACT|nr:OmpA family protein [Chryseotalea sanaruensis]GCC50261.1 hypothetical protein SanaruYs_04760 [Chryseotalea sanaruensis]
MDIKKVKFLLYACLLLSASVHAQLLTTAKVAAFNSTFDEQNPVLSADGNYLFVTRSNHPQNIGGLKDPGDIWIAHFNGAEWSAPVHAGSELNDKGYNTVLGTSPDLAELYIGNHFTNTGEAATTQGIAIAKFENGKWIKPKNISIPYFHSKSKNIQGQLSYDAQYFVYAAETYGTYGVEDIYVVSKTLNGWSEPKNLGKVINTSFQELSPSLNRSNDTLYFSSNGRKGKGSFDVYASARLDDTWQNWSEPVNIKAINTDGRDLFYKNIGRGNALYTSTFDSDGYGDVRFYDAGVPIIVDTISQVATPTVLTKSDETIVSGAITNAKTGQNINASLSFVSNANTAKTEASLSGYQLPLANNSTYRIIVEAKGYISYFQNVVLNEDQPELELDFALQPIEVGTTVNLKGVLFKQSSTDLLPESKDELNVVASFMNANPKVKIELSGHTDNRGVQKDNEKLSQARVQKVKEYLVANGVSAKRISGKGYGGAKPIAANDTEESRKLNRRVEFTIIKN